MSEDECISDNATKYLQQLETTFVNVEICILIMHNAIDIASKTQYHLMDTCGLLEFET